MSEIQQLIGNEKGVEFLSDNQEYEKLTLFIFEYQFTNKAEEYEKFVNKVISVLRQAHGQNEVYGAGIDNL